MTRILKIRTKLEIANFHYIFQKTEFHVKEKCITGKFSELQLNQIIFVAVRPFWKKSINFFGTLVFSEL